MKKSVVLSAALALCLISFIAVTGFVPSAVAAGTVKLGVVDFQRILTNSNYGKRATEELNRKGKGMEDDMKAKEGELVDLQKKFEKDSLVMSKDKKEEKQRELRTKFNDFKNLRSEYMKNFKELQASHFNKIRSDVLAVTVEIGKKEGFTMVIEKNEGGIMYSDGALDITDKVISEYNKKSAGK